MSSTATGTASPGSVSVVTGLSAPPPPGPVRPLDSAGSFQPVVADWTSESFTLSVPFRSQFDASPYQNSNCGPSSLAMVLLAYGLDVPNDRLRSIADSLQGTSGYNDGIALEYLQAIAQQAGLNTEGLFDANGHYHQWSMGDVIREIRLGHPVITLVHYASLPAHATSGSTADHYIVVVGVTTTGFVVNDPASVQREGYHQILRPEELLRAWHDANIQNQAVAFLPPPGNSGLGVLHDPAVPTVVQIVSLPPAATAPAAPEQPLPVTVKEAAQAGVALPPPNPGLVGWSKRVGSWQKASPLPTIRANTTSGTNSSGASSAIVLAQTGTSAPSPLPLLLVLGCVAAVAGGILSVPRNSFEQGKYGSTRGSKHVTVRDQRAVNGLRVREPRRLTPSE
ncbi:MAG TPA: C39 family peptidase [Chloroflexota bacterium]|nr:C39 family peptidase [Chloroflexota bacterium]